MTCPNSCAAALDASVRQVIDLLADGRAPDQANDLLHAALAVVAGTGGLCSMPAAVREIHRAEDELADGQAEHARVTLAAARRLIPAGAGTVTDGMDSRRAGTHPAGSVSP